MLNICGSTFEISEKALRRIAKEAFLYLGKDYEANLRFVSQKKIKELNRIYRNRDMATDVLTFNSDAKESGGDIAICYKEARNQAIKWHVALTDAASLLLVHGILHLDHYEHTKTLDRDKMEGAERVILRNAGVKIER